MNAIGFDERPLGKCFAPTSQPRSYLGNRGMMSSFNPDKHHRRSIRLRHYDYAQPGVYFVTICAHQREFLFGEIAGGEMRLNANGSVVQACWRALGSHFPNVVLGESVVMPNHIHGILALTDADARRGEAFAERHSTKPTTIMANASPRPRAQGTDRVSVGAIVQNFKSVSSRRIRQLTGVKELKVWQRNYYERVLRDDEEFRIIQEYIRYNPMLWDADQENPSCAKVGAKHLP